jgi:hypothetical protein
MGLEHPASETLSARNLQTLFGERSRRLKDKPICVGFSAGASNRVSEDDRIPLGTHVESIDCGKL